MEASLAEALVAKSLRLVLRDQSVGADLHNQDIGDSEPYRDLMVGLDGFIPEVLQEIHAEWKEDSLDGIYHFVTRKTGQREVNIFGLCMLLSDQTLTPIHVRLQIDASEDIVRWMECCLGEKGDRGLVRISCSRMNDAFKRMYL